MAPESAIDYGALSQEYKDLFDRDLLCRHSYGRDAVNSRLESFLLLEAHRANMLSSMGNAIIQVRKTSSGVTHKDPSAELLELQLKIAFYANDSSTIAKLRPSIPYPIAGPNSIRLFEYFDESLFRSLETGLQQWWLTDRMRCDLLLCDCTSDIRKLALEFLHNGATLCKEMVVLLATMCFAAGDAKGVEELSLRFGDSIPEVSAYRYLVQGQADNARLQFDRALSIQKSKSAKHRTLDTFSETWRLILAFRQLSPKQVLQNVDMACKSIQKNWPKPLDTLGSFIEQNAESPDDEYDFSHRFDYFTSGKLPFTAMVAGYLWIWLKERPLTFPVARIMAAGSTYKNAGYDWLADEADRMTEIEAQRIRAQSKLPPLPSTQKAPVETCSLVARDKPVADWREPLNAIRVALGDLIESPSKRDAPIVESSQRLIWEISVSSPHANNFSLQPFVQKRNKTGWTDGQRVAMKRLHSDEQDGSIEPSCPGDRILMAAVECSVSRNYSGYTETNYLLDESKAIKGIVGHPAIFLPRDRTTPIEVVHGAPQLTITKTESEIVWKISPKPCDGVVAIQESPQRISLISFTPRQLQIGEIIGKQKSFPLQSEEELGPIIRSLASHFTVHSEIGAAEPKKSAAKTNSVKASTHLVVQIKPAGNGLLFLGRIRPFGNSGPLCQPGQGSKHLLATMDGQAKSVARDLEKESEKLRNTLLKLPSLMEAQEWLNHHFEDSDAMPVPCDYTVDALVDALAVLEELQAIANSGDVELQWPSGQSMKLAGSAGVSNLRVQIKKDRDWFSLTGSLELDIDTRLELASLMELVESTPSRFIKLNDDRFMAISEQLRARIKELASVTRLEGTQRRFALLHAPIVSEATAEVTIKGDATWKKAIESWNFTQTTVPPIPSTLQAQLRDYQLDGYQWLVRMANWGAGVCLADDMGLGKTMQVLSLLLQRASGGPALVVAPSSVTFGWEEQCRQYAPSLHVKVFGDGDRKDFFKSLGPNDLVVCSYTLLQLESKLFEKQPWHSVILDEAQAIKNYAAKRSQAVMKLKADFRMILTGTPIENHLGELWSLFEFINPGFLGSQKEFQERFAVPIERDKNRNARQTLKRLLRPFLLRRLKSEVLHELPPKTETTLRIEMSEPEQLLYEAIRQRAVQSIAIATSDAKSYESKRLQILAEIMRLRRACCHPKLVLPESEIPGSKLAAFSETVEQLRANGHRVLVFSQFVDHLAILRAELERLKIRYQYLDGSTPIKQRKEAVEAFQRGEGEVFLISLRAGGFGLNLVGADYVIHMDPWWNPAVEDQASDRAHRIGQTRPVTIYRFIAENTIEDKILELHRSKRGLADELLADTDSAGKLSVEQLMELLSPVAPDDLS